MDVAEGEVSRPPDERYACQCCLVTMPAAQPASLRIASGDWEIIQFETATLVDVQTYGLNELCAAVRHGGRDQRSAGGGCVVRLARRSRDAHSATGERARIAFQRRYGPGNRDFGDASYVTVPFTFQGLGLRPLSQCTSRPRSGDISISWIRRTRSGGDNWEAPDVPLGEESESYEVDILDGPSVKRTIAVSAPLALYTSAEQVADFGSVQPAVSVKVYQTTQRSAEAAARGVVERVRVKSQPLPRNWAGLTRQRSRNSLSCHLEFYAERLSCITFVAGVPRARQTN